MRKLTLIITFILLTTSIHAAAADGADLANEPSDVAELAIRLYKEFGRVPTVVEYNAGIIGHNLSARYLGYSVLPYHFPYRPFLPQPPYNERFKEVAVWEPFLKNMEAMANLLAKIVQEQEHDPIIIDGVMSERGEEIMKKVLAISIEEAKEYIDAINKSKGVLFDSKAYISSRMREKEKSGHNF